MTIAVCKRDVYGFWECACGINNCATTAYCNRCNSGPAATTAAEELRAALARLLEAYETDVNIVPEMPVVISWETNSGAVAQAKLALQRND